MSDIFVKQLSQVFNWHNLDNLSKQFEVLTLFNLLPYKLFADFENKVGVGNTNNDVQNSLKTRFTHESGETTQKMPCTSMKRMNQLWKGTKLF